jgi:hypothetical protein
MAKDQKMIDPLLTEMPPGPGRAPQYDKVSLGPRNSSYRNGIFIPDITSLADAGESP